MKVFLVLAVLFILTLSSSECGKKKTAAEKEKAVTGDKKTSPAKYKGKLVVAGICKNYTIRLLEGAIDTSKIVAAWTNPVTNISYTSVFTPGNPCALPDASKEGDEFYFMIDTSEQKFCPVCLAFYPTPPRSLVIKIVEK
ncbi:MAG: hypothetical protein ABIT05_12165 [Chitinophagaceae bacterium]